MKCVPTCCALNLEQPVSSSCCEVTSKLRLVANMIVMLIGAGIIAGGIAGVVLFGSQLGLLYSTLIIGVAVGLGLLFLSLGVSCITCRHLISKSRRRLYVNDEMITKMKAELVQERTQVLQAGKLLSEAVERQAKVTKEYQMLLGLKLEAKLALERAEQELVLAQQENSSPAGKMSQSKRDSIVKQKTKLQQLAEAKYQHACRNLEICANEKLCFSCETAYNNFHGLWLALFEKFNALILKMEQMLLARQRELMDCSKKITEVENKIIKESTGSTKDAALIRELEFQLAGLRRHEAALEKDYRKQIDDLIKTKEEQVKKLSSAIERLTTEKNREILQTKLVMAETSLRREQEKLRIKEQEITKLQEQLKQSKDLGDQERQSLLKQIDQLQSSIRDQNAKIIKLSQEQESVLALKQNEETMSTLFTQERTNLELEINQHKNTIELLQTQIKDVTEKMTTLMRNKQAAEDEVSAKVVELTQLKYTLSLYERMMRDFEKKLEKRKAKDLATYVDIKDKMSKVSGGGVAHLSREDVFKMTSDEQQLKMMEQSKELEEYKALYAEKTKELSDLVSKQEAEISQYKQQLVSALKTIQKQNDMLSTKDQEIKDLRGQVVQLTERAAANQAVVNTMSLAMPARQGEAIRAITSSSDTSNNQSQRRDGGIN